MNVLPGSSSSILAGDDMKKTNEESAARAAETQQQPTDKPTTTTTIQSDHQQAMLTREHCSKKIIKCVSSLVDLVNPYLNNLTDETEACLVAMRLEQVTEIMQAAKKKWNGEGSGGEMSSSSNGSVGPYLRDSQRMMSVSSLVSKNSYPLERSISILSGHSAFASARGALYAGDGTSPLGSTYSLMSDARMHTPPSSGVLSSGNIDDETFERRQLLRRVMTPSARAGFMSSGWKSFGPPRLQSPDTAATCEDWREVAREAFQVMDVNKDGYLQKQEVFLAIALVKDNHNKFDDSHISDPALFVDTLMEEVDKDGDGQIDFDEFMEMMEKGLFERQSAGSPNHQGLPNQLLKITQFARNVFLAQQEKIESNTVGDDMWLIHPMSNFHFAWDIIVSLLILVVLITIPLSFGWEEFNASLLPLNLATDFVFLCDLCKSFFTGYIDENDVVVMDAKAVRIRYLRGYFTFDLLSSVPLDLIFDLVGLMDMRSSAIAVTKHSLKLLKLFRIAKLFRLRRENRFFQLLHAFEVYVEEKLNFRLSDGFAKVVRLFVGAFVLAHWIGCFNFWLVRLHEYPPDSWVVYAGLDKERATIQWTWAFFKALAQMIMIGFETPPFTNASCDSYTMWCQIEHWVTLGCLYIGAVFYSMLISSILSILQTTYLASRHFEEKLIQLDGYMKTKSVPVALRAKVKDHFHFQNPGRMYFDEEEVLKVISPIHLKEMRQFEVARLAAKVPLLSSPSNQAFVRSLANSLVQRIVFPGQIIFEERSTGDTMYFISSGLVELYLPSQGSEDPYLAIGDGCFFGEVSLLLGVKRTASARAKTQCVLFEIQKDDLIHVLRDFPQIAFKFKQIAKNRRRRLQHYVQPSRYSLPSELELDQEDQQTDLFGSSAANLRG